jgi:hypothetical protein
MSPTDQSIRPALTPEEWTIVEAEKGYATEERADLIGRSSGYARIAIYNATLPDGDPRKITRDDVRALDGWADYIDRHDPPPALKALAAKLAALLPPE